ncbi:hypothetical protein Bca52824_001568 [Brassica carinata]|uniref:Uncharacterized protein n=1 Tax=Brassica carinata TaxID=52824 RepID=A0A8X7WLS3_BRACI|nr:hypothetical protein Bca52824_001568 [Brassica carinata]
MVLRSKQKEAPVGRRMRLTAQNSRQSHPAKQQQYQVSNSDDSGAGSDKVSTAQGSMPAEVLGGGGNAYTQWSGGCSSTRNTRALQSLCILMLYVFVFSPMCHHQRSLEPGVSEIKNSYKSRGNQTLISTEPKIASTGIEDAQEPVSLNVCTEKFPYAAVDVGVRHVPIVEESNPECPTMEEDEKYDSCREDMSTDSYMQEKRGNPVSDTKEDSIYVASGGKRQRKISSKIRGVYTPDARLKGLFES